jgi:eukaryotic-like serine/threonine-protein kinase
MADDIVKFIRRKDYQLVRELGQGACGRTVLLYDEALDEYYVCKKYVPYSEAERSALFLNFVREIKLLHQVLHPNVVRLFNYFIYPDQQAGYLLMEHVDGEHIDRFAKEHPEKLGEIFEQAIDGFAYLESIGILHRDIRPPNLLARGDGVLKIIDLGFAKKISRSNDFDKSISLNWWCNTPEEFTHGRYDFATEVYFVGKLFERIIAENGLEYFPYMALLGRMCQYSPHERLGSFREVLAELQQRQFSELQFSISETTAYRAFSGELRSHLSKIESGATYLDDADLLLRQLEEAYRSVMLEEDAPDAAIILSCFVRGKYYYTRKGFRVKHLHDFLQVLRACRQEKRRILLANITATLDSIPRFNKYEDDDIPF